MYKKHRILAVVPARSGSKGIKDKNIQKLGPYTLLAHAARCIKRVSIIDEAILSTDSKKYQAEGKRAGLKSFFLRPPHLSNDTASAVDVLEHAVWEAENECGARFDILLFLEPTSPMRTPKDIKACVDLLLKTNADTVVSVNPVPTKYHPRKILQKHPDSPRIQFYAADGASLVSRQALSQDLFFRNGVCYALKREAFMEKRAFITDNSVAYVMDREVVNIDDPIELEWARFLYKKSR
jgi:CMP-N,N'-diacetyllegionaminic acid synthase